MIKHFSTTLGVLTAVIYLLPVSTCANELKTDFSVPGQRVVWSLNNWKGYLPHPEVKYDSAEKAWNISEVTAPYGFGMASYRQRLSVRAGDQVKIRFCVKGTGEFRAGLQYFSKNKWTGEGAGAKVSLTPEWKESEFLLTVTDRKNGPTDQAIVTFSCSRGSILWIRSISAIPAPGKCFGSLPFPEQWTVFVPVREKFTPSDAEFNEIPQTLDGRKGIRRELLSNTLDFAAYTGTQKRGVCGWAFAEIYSPENNSDYTIGAGADWWMRYYVNGKPVIDTLKSGNGRKLQIDNHIATVKLKKGRNILAVKFISGEKSSRLLLAGPADLRSLVKNLKTHRILWSDDYEKKELNRSGNPELIQGNPSPGTLILTGQGIYRTKNVSTILPVPNEFSVNTRDWFSTGIRIQNFSCSAGGKGSFVFHFSQGKKQFELQITHGPKPGTLLCRFLDDGKEIKRFSAAEKKLPADFQIFFSRNGRFVFVLNSLVDSSSSQVTGTSGFFRTLGSAPFTVKLFLKSDLKCEAKVIVDNFVIGLASPEKKDQARTVPFIIKPVRNFDPVKAGWKKVFSDEFDGQKVDTSKWSFSGDPKYITLDGKGNLQIRTDLNDKGKLETCSLLSKENFKYGWFEARLKFTKEPRCWSAFWLNRDMVTNTNAFLDGFEIDIFEDYYNRSTIHADAKYGVLDHNLHSRCGFSHLKSWNYISHLPRPIDDYFVIACKWTPFEISYYLDGKQIAATSRHSPYKTVTYDPFNHATSIIPLKVMFSGCVMRKGYDAGHWLPLEKGKYPQYFTIDYVRVYAFPEKDLPSIRFKGDASTKFVPVDTVLKFQAEVSVNPRTKSPVKAVYLFDNGYFLAYRTKPPYTFELPFNADSFRDTGYTRAGRGGQMIKFDGYPHTFVMFVQDAAGNVAHTSPVTRIPVFGESTPYQGKARKIPGTIFPGHYDEGGSGRAYHDTTKGNAVSRTFRPGEDVDAGEKHLGYTRRHEWLSYTVDIAESAMYTAQVRYAAPLAGKHELAVFLDGRQIGVFNLKRNTDGKWACNYTAKLDKLKLPSGRHKISLLIISPGVNLGELTFEKENR